MKKQTGVRLPEHVVEFLETRSKETNVSQSKILTMAIELLMNIDIEAVFEMARDPGIQPGTMVNVAIFYLKRMTVLERSRLVYDYFGEIAKIAERRESEQKEAKIEKTKRINK